jgi:hypothetical protein
MDAFHANYRRQKAALTRAINSRDPHKVITAAANGMVSFEQYGYPDDWSRWQRAQDDATSQIRFHADRWRRRPSRNRVNRRRLGPQVRL